MHNNGFTLTFPLLNTHEAIKDAAAYLSTATNIETMCVQGEWGMVVEHHIPHELDSIDYRIALSRLNMKLIASVIIDIGIVKTDEGSITPTIITRTFADNARETIIHIMSSAQIRELLAFECAEAKEITREKCNARRRTRISFGEETEKRRERKKYADSNSESAEDNIADMEQYEHIEKIISEVL